jgi:FkbM family methyltransferase
LSFVRLLVRKVRRHRAIAGQEWLWSALRPLYNVAYRFSGNGLPVRVGDCVSLRVPPEFSGFDFEGYEPPSVRRFWKWCLANPTALVVDIGSSVGVYTVLALSASKQTRVIAIDSDAASLKATSRLVEYCGPQGRLELLWGLLGDMPSGLSVTEAAKLTQRAMSKESGALGTTRYVNAGTPQAALTPTFLLDDILDHAISPALLKIDVKGTEYDVLRGARSILAKFHPEILISVHRTIDRSLPSKVARLISDFGYQHEVFDIDHEEHWWCKSADHQIVSDSRVATV